MDKGLTIQSLRAKETIYSSAMSNGERAFGISLSTALRGCANIFDLRDNNIRSVTGRQSSIQF